MSDECICGDCRDCRRSMRELDRRVSVDPPVELSAKARQILAEPAFSRPATKSDKPSETRRVPAARVSNGNSNNTHLKRQRRDRRYAERVMKDGILFHEFAPHGTYPGYNDYGCRCRPCKDSAANRQRTRTANGKESTLRADRRAERVLVDGKMVHPKAKHGSVSGYNYYGCRCEPCTKEQYDKKKRTKKSARQV